MLLTDMNGLYDRPPSEPGATIISEYYRDQEAAFRIGDKSSQVSVVNGGPIGDVLLPLTIAFFFVRDVVAWAPK